MKLAKEGKFGTILLMMAGISGDCAPALDTASCHTADVIVYGGTSAGVMAAVQASRMHKKVILVCPEKHLGGMTSGGLGWTDTGDKSVIGGLAREFYERVGEYYSRPDAWNWESPSTFQAGRGKARAEPEDAAPMWVFEPHVAEQVFEEFIAAHDIKVLRDQWLDRGTGVIKEGNRIQRIRCLSGTILSGKMFIDATYEGDLMAAAGVSYHVGRESNSQYGERWNGVQAGVRHHRHHFGDLKISPYRTPGDPSSGLLPRIDGGELEPNGTGDGRIQAYCFRMCLTDHPGNRVPFPKPDGYDAQQYELLLRVLDRGWREVFDKFDRLPNRKTDTNNHGPFSTDNIGMNYRYPEASYAERVEIIAEHERYQKGLMYFLSNDTRVPADVREPMSAWGLPKDEFTDNGNWPFQLYVREARRMIGQYVMTEHDIMGTRPPPLPVGMGSYTMDSHNVRRHVTGDGFVDNEGDVGIKPPKPYAIAYGSLVPLESECANLLVPVCVSSSHIAYGSIRMEPVFMILAQSAATAACLAIDSGVSVQGIDYARLAGLLRKDKQLF